jgi:hypothetical protein
MPKSELSAKDSLLPRALMQRTAIEGRATTNAHPDPLGLHQQSRTPTQRTLTYSLISLLAVYFIMDLDAHRLLA